MSAPAIPRTTGLFPALLAINAGIVATWHGLFGNPTVAAWACWTFLMAGLYATALRTIATQRAELDVLRQTAKSSP